jgi:hypothetical protein
MHKPRLFAPFVLLGIVLASGCASAGGGGSSEDLSNGAVEVNIWNRSDRTITVFARWQSQPRVRLGQLSGGRRGVYTTGLRGPRMAISWDVVSGSPPPATAGVGAAFPQVADSPGDPQCAVDVQDGDRIEWQIDVNARGCQYVRLDPAQ